MTILLKSADAVLGLNPDRDGFGPFTSVGVVGPYPAGADAAFEVRAFIPEIGEGEDPVTGSLNAGIAQWLMETDALPMRTWPPKAPVSGAGAGCSWRRPTTPSGWAETPYSASGAPFHSHQGPDPLTPFLALRPN